MPTRPRRPAPKLQPGFWRIALTLSLIGVILYTCIRVPNGLESILGRVIPNAQMLLAAGLVYLIFIMPFSRKFPEKNAEPRPLWKKDVSGLFISLVEVLTVAFTVLIWPWCVIAFVSADGVETALTGVLSPLPFLEVIVWPLYIFVWLLPLITVNIFFFRTLSPKKKLPLPAQEIKTRTSQPTFLVEAVLSGHAETVTAALTANPCALNAPYPANDNTPLHIAAWNGYTDIVKLLLAQPGIDKNAKNHAGKTPLELAKERNCADIAALLTQK